MRPRGHEEKRGVRQRKLAKLRFGCAIPRLKEDADVLTLDCPSYSSCLILCSPEELSRVLHKIAVTVYNTDKSTPLHWWTSTESAQLLESMRPSP